MITHTTISPQGSNIPTLFTDTVIFLWVVQLKVLLVSQQMGAYVVILGHMLQVLNSPMGSLCARTHAAAEASLRHTLVASVSESHLLKWGMI